MDMSEIFIQTLWAFMIVLATWFCFEGSRFDPTPMRLVAFVAIGIGVLHSAHELGRLAEVLHGYPLDRQTGWEILLPFVLVILKYFGVVSRQERLVHG